MKFNPEYQLASPDVEAMPVPDYDHQGEEVESIESEDSFEMSNEDWLDMRNRIDQIECDQDRLIESWQASAKNGIAPGKNVEVAEVLDELRPGAVGFLEDEYDMEHFARYPLELLVDMYDNRNESGNWGLFIYAKNDHNDASYYKVPALREMYETIGQDTHIRIVECDSVNGAGDLLAKLAKKHGKAGFLGIWGHGSPDSITLGEGHGAERKITKGNVSEQFAAYRGYLDEDAEICLCSCSTAAGSGSIAHNISDSTDRTTTGPTADSSLVSFGAAMKGGKVRFEPTYSGAQANRIEREDHYQTSVADLLVGTLAFPDTESEEPLKI